MKPSKTMKWIRISDQLPKYEVPVLFASPGEKRKHWIIRLGHLAFSDAGGHHFRTEPADAIGTILGVEFWQPLDYIITDLMDLVNS